MRGLDASQSRTYTFPKCRRFAPAQVQLRCAMPGRAAADCSRSPGDKHRRHFHFGFEKPRLDLEHAVALAACAGRMEAAARANDLDPVKAGVIELEAEVARFGALTGSGTSYRV